MIPVLAQPGHLGAKPLEALCCPSGFFFWKGYNLRARSFQFAALGFAEQSGKEVAYPRSLRWRVGDDDLFVGCIRLGGTRYGLCQRW